MGKKRSFFDYPVDAETLDKARRVLETYDVASWAGFRGSDPNVLDGYSMSFQVEFVDGSRIEAFGENKFPKNYHDVFSELDDLTVEAKNAFYEEQVFFLSPYFRKSSQWCMGYLKREVIALFICKPPINQGFKGFRTIKKR